MEEAAEGGVETEAVEVVVTEGTEAVAIEAVVVIEAVEILKGELPRFGP